MFFYFDSDQRERLRRAVRSISINCDWLQTLGACTTSVLDDDDDDDGDVVSRLLPFFRSLPILLNMLQNNDQ